MFNQLLVLCVFGKSHGFFSGMISFIILAAAMQQVSYEHVIINFIYVCCFEYILNNLTSKQ
ncbi:MAG: hypothetical protein DA407_01840 [Bacteroidetes bacterium]|nr:MAG: hypothetical protein DA407_01840 [Bacteroidota bacterium]